MFKHLFRRNFHGAPFRQPVAIPDPISTLMPQLQRKHYWSFWVALAVGSGGLVGLTDVTITEHSKLFEVIFIVSGSLLTPILFVYFLDLHNLFVDPRWKTIVLAFVLGAVIGVPLALVLELTLPSGTGNFVPAMATGFIEEFAKVVATLWLLRKRFRYLSFEMDGIILGAAVGMGFAALEDMFYATDAFSNGLTDVAVVVWLRAILGAFGHGTWTAIIVGTIWKAKGAGSPRLTPMIVVAYLISSILHGAWDWLPLGGVANFLWFIGVGILGLIFLRSMVHEALDQEKRFLAAATPVQPLPAAPE